MIEEDLAARARITFEKEAIIEYYEGTLSIKPVFEAEFSETAA
jgi:hypothetical protein